MSALDLLSAPVAARDGAGGRLHLTGRGVALLTAAVLALAGAALAGIQELFVLAAAALALLCLAVVVVAVQRVELSTARQVVPGQVVAGEPAAVALTVTARGRRASPPVSLRDPFDGGRDVALFALARLRAGERLSGGYRLPPVPRGRYLVGPLQLDVSDPFGLVSRTMPGAAASPLVVHPRLVHLERPAPLQGFDRFGTGGRGAFEPGGEDFAALRPYRAGDDLRHVHWPSTARMEQLMVRQTDAAAEPRSTVAVDLRAGLWDPEQLDEALSAAGGMLEAAHRVGMNVRLLTTPSDAHGPLDTGFGRSEAHWARVLEALATAQAGRAGSASLVDLLAPAGNGTNRRSDDTLIVVTSSAAAEADLRGLSRLAPEESLIVAVFGPASAPIEPSAVAGRLLQVEEFGKFAAAWDRLAPRHDRAAPR